MNEFNSRTYYDRLKQRRDEIMMTRRHLRKEQCAIDENKEWIDQAAYQSRINLLGNLSDWYAEEATQVDTALKRIAEGTYGVCLACHASIETERLDTMPAAAFCAGCQDMREELSDH
jgi:RNA polymerase-binding transcription factor DksA